MKVYLDNAATTPLAPEVLEVMMPYLQNHFGNPSSTHQFGRTTKAAIEVSRKKIAKLLNCMPGEICFTSGGTEADNMAIRCAIRDLGVRHIISSPTEHHAVLHSVEQCEKENVRISLVQLDDKGHVDLDHLRTLLAEAEEKTLVSLMHANNEVGTMLDLKVVSEICEEYGAIFHSDTVQTMGHFPIDVSSMKIHFIVGAAHKFHGPKGVGFLYINKTIRLKPLIHGGSQERNMRAGTENLYGIVGMAKALEMAVEQMDEHKEFVEGIKQYMKMRLQGELPDVEVNGCEERSLYTVLNVRLPESQHSSMLLFLLDIDGIACSGGSACSAGSNQGSHVLRALNTNQLTPSVRFSFSRYTTKAEIDYVVERLKFHLMGAPVAALRK